MTPTTERGMKSRTVLVAVALALGCTAVGCRQKMAQQPYYRPYEETDSFPDKRSARPLERGTIHRGQRLVTDPMTTGLTRGEWARAFSRQVAPKVDPGGATRLEDREITIGAPRFDPPGFDAAKYGGTPHPAPANIGAIYVDAYPFPITKDDLKRGQERYTIYCAVCHGPLGNGQGKIWERGYLTPTSFHTEPVDASEVIMEQPRDIPLGFSRGYALWGIKIPMRDVPIGYYYEVITKGYAGMPSYSAQIPPDDRWRIIAYIRALQLSQYAEATKLPPELKQKLDAGGKQ